MIYTLGVCALCVHSLGLPTSDLDQYLLFYSVPWGSTLWRFTSGCLLSRATDFGSGTVLTILLCVLRVYTLGVYELRVNSLLACRLRIWSYTYSVPLGSTLWGSTLSTRNMFDLAKVSKNSKSLASGVDLAMTQKATVSKAPARVLNGPQILLREIYF